MELVCYFKPIAACGHKPSSLKIHSRQSTVFNNITCERTSSHFGIREPHRDRSVTFCKISQWRKQFIIFGGVVKREISSSSIYNDNFLKKSDRIQIHTAKFKFNFVVSGRGSTSMNSREMKRFRVIHIIKRSERLSLLFSQLASPMPEPVTTVALFCQRSFLGTGEPCIHCNMEQTDNAPETDCCPILFTICFRLAGGQSAITVGHCLFPHTSPCMETSHRRAFSSKVRSDSTGNYRSYSILT
jgi:hypothetical protein